MRFQTFISSRGAIELGVLLSRVAPRWVGYGVAKCFASILVRAKPEPYWIVSDNLRHVVAPGLDTCALHQSVHRVFCHAGQTYYDLFRALGQPLAAHRELVHIPDIALARVTAELDAGRGVLLVGPHISNFNLAILAMAAHGLSVQVLSLPSPGAGFRTLNRLLAGDGIEITPLGAESLRQAVRRLEGGGLVFTGADYPPVESEPVVEFFGKPSRLPTGPARMALLTGASVVVGSCFRDRRYGYAMEITEPLQLVRRGDRRADVLDNTRRIAQVLECFVSRYPTQWLMFQRLWPGP